MDSNIGFGHVLSEFKPYAVFKIRFTGILRSLQVNIIHIDQQPARWDVRRHPLFFAFFLTDYFT